MTTTHPKAYWDSLEDFAEDAKANRLFDKLDEKPVFLCKRARTTSTRSLFCHDYKGGYYEKPNECCFTFNWWHFATDFVYFSHHRVSPPPSQWITAAHKNGVKIYGALIFEHEQGSRDSVSLLQPDPLQTASSALLFLGEKHPFAEVSMQYADLIIDLAIARGFDGWLLNFECDLGLEPRIDEQRRAQQEQRRPRRRFAKQHARALVAWVAYLSNEAKRRIGPHAEIIWYDAVTVEGLLKWQCALTEANLAFAKAAGNIFLDYHWTLESLIATSEQLPIKRDIKISFKQDYASSPAHLVSGNVFVGVDCFGRGQYLDGGFFSGLALQHIVKTGLSAAIFGFGWLSEGSDLPANRTLCQQSEDERFFYTGGPITDSAHYWHAQLVERKEKEAEERHNNSSVSVNVQVPSTADMMPLQAALAAISPTMGINDFVTSFSLGCGLSRFEEGKKVLGPWTDLSMVNTPPDLIYPLPRLINESGECSTGLLQAGLDWDKAYDGGQSVRIRKQDTTEQSYLPICSVELPEGAYTVTVAVDSPQELAFAWSIGDKWSSARFVSESNQSTIWRRLRALAELDSHCTGIGLALGTCSQEFRLGQIRIKRAWAHT